MKNLRREFDDRLNQKQDALPAMPGVLGDFSGQVNAGGGMVYVQVAQTVEVALCLTTPKIAGLQVWVGYTPHQPNVLQVLGQRVGYGTSSSPPQPGVGAHAASHEWFGAGPHGGTDVVKVQLGQFMPLRVFPAGGMTIGIYPGIVRGASSYVLVADTNTFGMPIPKILDLWMDLPAAGMARYVLISIDSSGVVVATLGAEVAIAALTPSDIPAPPADTLIALAAVRLWAGQQAIVENRESKEIVDLRFPILHYHPASELNLKLDELSDVTITTPADGEVLGYSAGIVINKTLAEAGIATAGHEHRIEELSNVAASGEAVGDLLQISDWIEISGGAESLYDSALLTVAGSGTLPANAYNKNFTDQWISMGGPHWTTASFSRKRFVTKIVITANAGDWMWADYPKSWNIYGSNTGTFGGEEALMGSGSNTGPAINTTTFTAPHTGYRYYKITFPTNTNLRVNEIQFYVQADEPKWENKTLAGAGVAPSGSGVTNGDSHDHSGGDGAQINHTTLSNIGTNTHAQIDTHIGSTANPHSVTKAQVGLGSVANILDKLDATVAPTVNEDSGDGYSIGSHWLDITADKAYVALDVTVGAAVWKEISGTAGSDTSAIHDNESGEIAAITEKTTPVDADVTIIEDSAATNAKKKLSWVNIKATLKTYFDTKYMHRYTSAEGAGEFNELTDLGTVSDNTIFPVEEGVSFYKRKLDHATIRANIHQNYNTTFRGVAGGVASLNASTKVVENPANATATPTASKIPIADTSGLLDGWITRDGWVAAGATWTYVDAKTFTVSGDVTATYQKGTFLRWKQGGGWKYGVVASSAYASPNTTVTIIVNTDYTIANAAITDPWYSYAANPLGWPKIFAYTATLTTDSGAFTNASATGYFGISGNLCSVYFFVVITTNGTAAGINVSLPIAEQSLATLVGREGQATGVILQGFCWGGKSHIFNYAGNYINADGRTVYMNGEYWF